MKLIVSSASFAAALAVFAPKYSNAAMASAVDAAYENENKVEQAVDKHAKSRSLGEECSFASSGLRVDEADTGILGCAEDFVCVEDSRSSLGGHCVSVGVRDVSKHHRDLQTCTKCTGQDACKWLNDAQKAKIADDSCCGDYACYDFYVFKDGKNAPAYPSIGAGSCLGKNACAYVANGKRVYHLSHSLSYFI